MTPDSPDTINAAVLALVRRAEVGDDIAEESLLLKARVIAFLDAGGFAVLVVCRRCEIKYPIASESRTIVALIDTLACVGCTRKATLREDKRARAWREIHKREAQHEAMKRAGRE